MCRSKRPGLIRAGSKISARLVPAKTTTLVLLLKPVKKRGKFYPRNEIKSQALKERALLPTIHFHKQLVEGVFLLALVTKVSSTSLPAYCIDLVNEQDAWGIFSSSSKHIPYLKQNRKNQLNIQTYIKMYRALHSAQYWPLRGRRQQTFPGTLSRWWWWRGHWPPLQWP